VRAPSQAAINAAILAAQRASGTVPDADDDDSSSFYSNEEEEEEEEEGSSEGEEAPAAAAGGKRGGEGGAAAQPSGARLQTNRVLTPEEFILGELAKQAGGVSVHTQATWPGAAMLVLTKASGAAGWGWWPGWGTWSSGAGKTLNGNCNRMNARGKYLGLAFMSGRSGVRRSFEMGVGRD